MQLTKSIASLVLIISPTRRSWWSFFKLLL